MAFTVVLGAMLNNGTQIVTYVRQMVEPTPVTLSALEALRTQPITRDSVTVTVHRAETK